MKWNEMKWNEMKWNEMKWNEMKWNEIKWNEMKWTDTAMPNATHSKHKHIVSFGAVNANKPVKSNIRDH